MSRVGSVMSVVWRLRDCRGFTLVEVLVAMFIMTVAMLGFLMGTVSVIQQRARLGKMQNASNIVAEAADRLQRLSVTDPLLAPKSGHEAYLGYDGSGNLKKCSGGAPVSDITVDSMGMTEFTNPWNGSSLYLYDNNLGTFSASVNIATSANASIDHPNSSDSASTINNEVSPIRQYSDGTTYYTVWSVVYLPCTTTQKDQVKIFITTYWIEPEPSETSVSAVNSKLVSGEYKLKKVSLSIVKAYKVEQ